MQNQNSVCLMIGQWKIILSHTTGIYVESTEVESIEDGNICEKY